MTVYIEKEGPVTTIVLSRPGVRNAVDRDAAQELADAFHSFEIDKEARAAVFSGDQGQFCAGADLKKIAEGKPNRMEPAGDGPMGPTRLRLSKPVIAAISGYAVAGGLELALWCDLRVMEEDAVLGVFSRRWGVPLIDGGTVRLPRLIGLSRALDLILNNLTCRLSRPWPMNSNTVFGLWKKRPGQELPGLQKAPAVMVILKSLIKSTNSNFPIGSQNMTRKKKEAP